MRKALFFLSILSDSDVEWLIRSGTKSLLAKGAVLVHEGQPTDWLYFVLDGEFEVFTRRAPRVAILKSGEVVGEISFIDSRPPTASVKALVESRVAAIPRSALTTKLREDAGFGLRFYRALAMFLADRLRTTVGNLGSAPESDSGELDELDELAPYLMDNISMAGARFSEMQRRSWGGW